MAAGKSSNSKLKQQMLIKEFRKTQGPQVPEDKEAIKVLNDKEQKLQVMESFSRG